MSHVFLSGQQADRSATALAVLSGGVEVGREEIVPQAAFCRAAPQLGTWSRGQP